MLGGGNQYLMKNVYIMKSKNDFSNNGDGYEAVVDEKYLEEHA